MSAIANTTSTSEGTSLLARYKAVREQSIRLCEPLENEDYQVQPMDDASPPKWHLAHVTWFFETFLVKPLLPAYEPLNPAFEMLFNSYYNGVGTPFTRANRGNLSRPTLAEVMHYRAYVDREIEALIEAGLDEDHEFRVVLGLHHEQQHQELILTDLKYNLGNNPLLPAYLNGKTQPSSVSGITWHAYPGGLVETGTDGSNGFVFDNETPAHQVYLQPFELANRPVTSGEFIEFIEDDGYDRPELWLSDGWAHLDALQENRWRSPLYWHKRDGEYFEYTLSGGERQVDRQAPVCHVSGYEADAYARWSGARLPTESEWEHAAAVTPGSDGELVESGQYHPVLQLATGEMTSLTGNVWEWTSSSYGPYPGYKPFAGQLGEYNGKFMANQLVLRGGSCATPASHIRRTYRNFFYPPDRWQFSGIRLARDIDNRGTDKSRVLKEQA